MAEEQQPSSLRSAIDRIMGWQPGGSGAEGQQQGPVTLAAPTPFSSADVGNAINTVSAISNEVPAVAADPFAAELAAIRAQNVALQSQIAAPAASSSAAPAPMLSYDQYVAQQSAANQGRAAIPKNVSAIGYNQYTLAQPRAQPMTRDQYAQTVADQYERAGWNRQGIVPPSQQLIDTGYQSYLKGGTTTVK